jgi:foldase protein PrsA
MEKSYKLIVSPFLALVLLIMGCMPGQSAPLSVDTPPRAVVLSAMPHPLMALAVTVNLTGDAPSVPAVLPMMVGQAVTDTITVNVTPSPDWAALVNGQPVMKVEYEKQLNLAKKALEGRGQDLKTEDGKKILEGIRQQVLQDMINLVLIEQAAAAQGVVVTQQAIDAATDKSIKEGGGRPGFEKWLKDTGQTEADYKIMIRASLLTEAIGAKITGQLPERAPQVHARHILLGTEPDGQKVLQELKKKGGDFVALAKKYSIEQSTKDKGGDLGWLTRNMLPAEIDTVIFSLEPKQISGVISDTFGTFHVIQVIEKDPNRKLTNEQRAALNNAAFMSWLVVQRQAAKIETFIDFSK